VRTVEWLGSLVGRSALFWSRMCRQMLFSRGQGHNVMEGIGKTCGRGLRIREGVRWNVGSGRCRPCGGSIRRLGWGVSYIRSMALCSVSSVVSEGRMGIAGVFQTRYISTPHLVSIRDGIKTQCKVML
jgi:hypothetical protein